MSGTASLTPNGIARLSLHHILFHQLVHVGQTNNLWFRLLVFLLVTVRLSWSAFAQDQIQLTYLGNAGWEVTDGKTVVLVDPYLTRFKINVPNDRMRSDDPRPSVTRDEIVGSDRAIIDAHIKRADFIVVTHTHVDHVFDVPYIAKKPALW